MKLDPSGNFNWAISPESSVPSNYVTLCETTTGAGGSGWDGGFCMKVQNNAIYITGAFDHTVDFDPNAGSFNLTATSNNNSKDIFVHKLFLCQNSINSITVSACNSFISPSGDIHTTSGVFNDTIPNAAGCDSIITINLTINQNTSSLISPSACGTYTAPDGQVYTASGNFSAVIPNSNGCDSTISINLTILPIPTISAGVNQTVCDGNSVTLTGSGGVVYTWDNSIVNGVSFVPLVGINEYVVSGMSANGCFDTDTVIVTVNALPTVSFTIDETSGCAPLVFNLTNTSLNSIDCSWDISNGDDLIGCGTVTGVLNQMGCHDITLTTTDNNGCSNSYTATSIICVEALPNASFSASTNSFSQPGEQVVFTNNSTGAASYSWNFGDSSPISTADNPTHVYEVGVQDSFIVELIAVSTLGCSDTSYLTIYDTSVSDSVDTDIFIPTGFSPNSDNENDTWEVTGLEKYPNAIINVFNRWGQLLFDGGYGNSVWSGVYQGEILPTADYYYIVDLGNGTKFNGVVTLKQ
jgi:gliding motility-associated-like protein